MISGPGFTINSNTTLDLCASSAQRGPHNGDDGLSVALWPSIWPQTPLSCHRKSEDLSVRRGKYFVFWNEELTDMRSRPEKHSQEGSGIIQRPKTSCHTASMLFSTVAAFSLPSPSFFLKLYFLVARTLHIFTLNTFLSVWYDIAICRYSVVQTTSGRYSAYIIKTLWSASPHFPPPAPGNYCITFCFYGFISDSSPKWGQAVCPSVMGLCPSV